MCAVLDTSGSGLLKKSFEQETDSQSNRAKIHKLFYSNSRSATGNLCHLGQDRLHDLSLLAFMP